MALQRARLSTTKFKAFFALNRNDPEARQYLYADIPLHYAWQTKSVRALRSDASDNDADAATDDVDQDDDDVLHDDDDDDYDDNDDDDGNAKDGTLDSAAALLIVLLLSTW